MLPQERRHPEGPCAVGHDVRDRRAADLERAHADLERLLSAAAHDLREPLRAINGFGELLQRESGDDLDERGQEFLRLILQAGRRMEDLLEGLSRYGRAGRAGGAPCEVDLGSALDAVLQRLHEDVASRRARVTHDDLPVVHASRGAVEQVLEQLIENGVKFSRRPRPHVHVQAAQDDSRWQLTVTDDGIGVPDRERDRIFDMFRRLHPRDAYPGSGVGLAICKRIVERDGGRIWVEDGPAGGSAFHVALPGRWRACA